MYLFIKFGNKLFFLETYNKKFLLGNEFNVFRRNEREQLTV